MKLSPVGFSWKKQATYLGMLIGTQWAWKILSAILQPAPTAVTEGGVGGHFRHYWKIDFSL